ncbi:molybdopterin oxidoreductase family protein [Leptospira ilyithenensis]|uniref:Molybdopterin oxidoreductase family protein n=1 Tax=Leptospira ilyithenensis TaxID=2484901 RepID=A0A4R9LLQ1_9LEPT|nr:molybdopterin oxidoreductase family protein [Leptospira ilyithenensis]TGN08502.1 molybdopterin oxidoreductase family protein [Leptospira ilyithenensis]
MDQIHYRACTICEAMCGLQIEVKDGFIAGFKGDPEDKFSRGHICPKGPELKSLYQDPDRIKFPIKRTESGWEPVSWQEAFSDIATQIIKIQEQYGNDSVAVYNGNPNVHNYGSMLFGQRFASRLKTKNNFSATSVDQLPHQLLSYLMFGHQLLIPIPDIDHTDFFLILGGNPFASNGSLMSVPDVKKRLKAIQERGGKYIVVDPRKTETASHADEHIFIRPGTDAYFLFAIVNVLFERKMVQKNDLISEADLDEIRNWASEYSPKKVEKITGISSENIERIAEEFANAKTAVCYGRVGVSTQEFGAICQWLINVINIITGNLDKRGGAMFTLPAVDLVGPGSAMRSSPGSFNAYQSRVRKLPEFSEELPVAALAEEILTPGEGKIRALFTSAGNPVLSTPNGTKLDLALSGLDFMVCVDFYLNETTKHANYILPPTSALEHDHYDLIFNVFAVRNTTRYSQPLFDPEPGMLHDWEIFSDLTKRLELVRAGKPLPKEIIRTKLTPASIIDHALKTGPYGPKGKLGGEMSLDLLKNSPHGVDLGPLQSCFPERLCTEDQKIRLVPLKLKEDFPRLSLKFKEWESFTEGHSNFLLIGRRHLRSNNSWMHNLPKLMTGKPRCTLMIHPEDASRLGIADDEKVIVESSAGSVLISAEVTKELMKGVVSIPHGFGHNRTGTNQKVATEFSGVSINDLTDDQSIDVFSGNAAFSGIKVSIKKQNL